MKNLKNIETGTEIGRALVQQLDDAPYRFAGDLGKGEIALAYGDESVEVWRQVDLPNIAACPDLITVVNGVGYRFSRKLSKRDEKRLTVAS